MAFTRWKFYDPVSGDTYTFELNPSDGGDREYEKNVSTAVTTAPDGQTILFEGRDKPGEITWKGVFRSLAARDAMVTWWRKRTQLLVTKDYGEQMWIYLTKLSPSRKRVVNIPYKAEYDVHAFVLDIPVPDA